jgi:hypothetical protein
MANENELGIRIPEIMLPEGKVNMKKWAVVACDQFTSQPDYWNDVQRFVGSAPSTYQMILPEAFLHENDRSDRIAKIKGTMKNYVESGVLAQLPRGIVLVERTVGNRKRKGIMLAIDLEQYDFQPGNKALIRATEKTVLERIPPRMEVRSGAILETPHAMLVLNDINDTVIGPLYKKRDTYFKLYGFDLMMDGGYLNGWFIENNEEIQCVIDALAELKQSNEMLFAVGDGNHSLVTAKAVWEEAKEKIPEEEQENNPMRYALVEVVNLYDPGLKFEPIHRVVFNVQPSVCINDMMGIIQKRGYRAKMIYSRANAQSNELKHVLPFVTKDTMGRIEIENPKEPLVVGTLQDILDEYIELKENANIDYIHGDDTFAELSKQYGATGFRLTGIEKEDLFPYVYKYGILPKKCFSMGEAEEKRYYMECRLLVKLEEEKQEIAEETAEPTQTPENEATEDIAETEAPQVPQAPQAKAARKAPDRAAKPKMPEIDMDDIPGDVPDALDEIEEFDDFDDFEELDEDQILHYVEAEDDEPDPIKKKRSLMKQRIKTHI